MGNRRSYTPVAPIAFALLSLATLTAFDSPVEQNPRDAASDSGTIVFTLKRAGVSKIYSIAPDGTGLRLLTRDAPKRFGGDLTPSWSPDGSTVLFSRLTLGASGEQLHVYRMPASGGRAVQLTRGDEYEATPVSSRDGQTIAFTGATRPGASVALIYQAQADGSDPTPLGSGRIFRFAPSFAPDSKTLAFGATLGVAPAGKPVRLEIAELVLEGLKPYDPPPYSIISGIFPRWSPNGQQLAFVSVHDGNGRTCFAHVNVGRLVLGLSPTRPAAPTRCLNNGEIYVVGLDGRNPIRITMSRGDDNHPSWSPDGRALALTSGFLNGRGPLPALYTIDLATRKRTLVFRPKRGYVTYTDWTPASAD
jgi:Tol biopolymer transport system component